MFAAYILCTLTIIQIWNFSTYYINILMRLADIACYTTAIKPRRKAKAIKHQCIALTYAVTQDKRTVGSVSLGYIITYRKVIVLHVLGNVFIDRRNFIVVAYGFVIQSQCFYRVPDRVINFKRLLISIPVSKVVMHYPAAVCLLLRADAVIADIERVALLGVARVLDNILTAALPSPISSC